MNNLKPYTNYKPSNIAWLGDIPEHWEVKRIKNLGKAIIGIIYDPRDLCDENDGILVLRSSNVQNEKIDYRDCIYVNQKIRETQITRKGDILICSRNGSINLIGKSAIIEGNAIGKTFGAFMTIFRGDCNEYVSYFLKSSQFKAQIGLCFTSTINQLTSGILYNLFLALPSCKQEQQAIANFLDYKLSKIDRFIQKKKQLIKLLNEQKAGIINDAVTKGLDPNAKMKPSGIEWLGDIPEHWEVTRIKYLGKSFIGITYSPTEITDENDGVLVLRSSNVQNEKIDYRDCVYVKKKIPEHQIVKAGDLLICSRNGSAKLIGKNALIDENSAGNTFGAFMTIFRSPYFEYLHYFFNSSSFKAQSGLFSTSTINQLTNSILNNIIVSFPCDFEEQLKIVSYIKEETAQINTVIQTIEKEIALVQEYRVALIAEAVTGKIDVRDYEIPETPIVDLYEELEDEMSLAAEDEVGYSTEN